MAIAALRRGKSTRWYMRMAFIEPFLSDELQDIKSYLLYFHCGLFERRNLRILFRQISMNSDLNWGKLKCYSKIWNLELWKALSSFHSHQEISILYRNSSYRTQNLSGRFFSKFSTGQIPSEILVCTRLPIVELQTCKTYSCLINFQLSWEEDA